MRYFYFLLLLATANVYAECVHEKELSGYELINLKSSHHIYESNREGIFKKLSNNKLLGLKMYKVQLRLKSDIPEGEFESYNKRFIEYYRYQNIVNYISSVETRLETLGYKSSIVGQSLKGRSLYAIKPLSLNPLKKTIVMFGRHHGDEGTANWIIEGFVNEFLKVNSSFHDNFQLILYPMINPDGAEAMTRYNDNGRDLNRSWDSLISKNYDEAKTIHIDLKKYLKASREVPVVLDMHGSFTDDFIYRVKKNFIDSDFFRLQQNFITELSAHDIWQNGMFKLSNGHKKMARLVLVKSYGLNALTHETPRDIQLKSPRSKSDLLKQGADIFNSILNLYSNK
jgi:hypothetical protein